jgi:GTP-binding protein HflX
MAIPAFVADVPRQTTVSSVVTQGDGWPIETIYGNFKGLKPSQLKQLQRLYHQRLPGDCITTPEFAQRLAAVSTDIKLPVCAYVNRRGQVIRVGVGTLRQTQIPQLELPRYGAERLSGIRCLATQFAATAPGDDLLTTMALQRLDVLAILCLSGSGSKGRGRSGHRLCEGHLPGSSAARSHGAMDGDG